jgi:hypothetical protein
MIRQLQAETDAWLTTYSTRRRKPSASMAGPTPEQTVDLRTPNKGSARPRTNAICETP